MKEFARPDEHRILELLADRVAFGLEPEDQAELTELLRLAPEFDAEAMERVAAEVEISRLGAGPEEEMPRNLREKIAANASRHIKCVAETHPSSPAAAEQPGCDSSSPMVATFEERPATGSRSALFALAASALVAVGVFYVWHGGASVDPVGEYRMLLSASNTPSAGIVKAAWSDPAKPDDKTPHGDVVWSGGQQRGFMRFRNLPMNDPKKEQYQLWIFDTAQDDRYPIDGGVFDINAAERDPATGDVIVPIAAKLAVKNPTMFAVTIEKPGGVVVSDRSRLPLLAKVN